MSEEARYFGRQPWSMAAEGILALIIGAFILVWPGLTLVTLTWIVGIFVLLAGICALISLIGSHKGQRGVLIAGGLFGIYRIVHAIRQPPEDHSRWLDICLGIISLVVGVILIALPTLEGLEDLALLLGIYAVIAGILLICLAGAEWSKRKHMQTG
jgi:uncharacterized membrane protein HdeD (DUF308 family)